MNILCFYDSLSKKFIPVLLIFLRYMGKTCKKNDPNTLLVEICQYIPGHNPLYVRLRYFAQNVIQLGGGATWQNFSAFSL